MKEINIKINDKKYKVKLAETEEDQEIGLQGISNLDTNEGMLFVFDSPGEISF